MLQRWLKTWAVLTVSGMLFSACQKQNYSKDEPLDPVYSPSLFISSQNQFLYSLDPNTGARHWEYNLHANQQATPFILKNFLFVAAEDSLFKFDVNTGKLIRTFGFDNALSISLVASPSSQGSINGNILYVASLNDTLYALDINSDRIVWKFATSAPISAAPTYFNGKVIVASDKVYAIAASNGALSWSAPITVQYSSPAVGYPYVYVGGMDGQMHALDLNTGTDVWDYPTGGQILSSPIVYGGNVIFGSSDKNVYCLDSVAKQPRWVYPTDGRVLSSPFASNQTIYFGSTDYFFYAVNVIDGSLKWKYNTNALIKSSPLVKDNHVYVAGFNKILYDFDTSGSLRWSRDINGAIETSPVLYDLSNAYYPATSGNTQ